MPRIKEETKDRQKERERFIARATEIFTVFHVDAWHRFRSFDRFDEGIALIFFGAESSRHPEFWGQIYMIL